MRRVTRTGLRPSRPPQPQATPSQTNRNDERERSDCPIQDGRADRGTPSRRRVPEMNERCETVKKPTARNAMPGQPRGASRAGVEDPGDTRDAEKGADSNISPRGRAAVCHAGSGPGPSHTRSLAFVSVLTHTVRTEVTITAPALELRWELMTESSTGLLARSNPSQRILEDVAGVTAGRLREVRRPSGFALNEPGFAANDSSLSVEAVSTVL